MRTFIPGIIIKQNKAVNKEPSNNEITTKEQDNFRNDTWTLNETPCSKVMFFSGANIIKWKSQLISRLH